MLTIVADGLCEPNPGGYGCWAFVAIQDGKIVAEQYACLGKSTEMTNNVAEYAAIGYALRWCLDNGHHGPRILTDSQLAVRQISGQYACRAAGLQTLLAKVTPLIAQTGASVSWVSREETLAADFLTRKAYQEHTGRPCPQRTHLNRRP